MAADELLMLDIRRGSRLAFEELFARYHQPIYAFFRRRLAARERAEDLTQETFLAVLRAARRYEPRSTVRSYLFGIAFHLLAAERRALARCNEVEPAVEPAAPPRSDDCLYLRQALAKLEETEHEILMLREYEELSYAPAAELLDRVKRSIMSRSPPIPRVALATVLGKNARWVAKDGPAGATPPCTRSPGRLACCRPPCHDRRRI